MVKVSGSIERVEGAEGLTEWKDELMMILVRDCTKDDCESKSWEPQD